jgi:glucose/arabinose dehydrogenase
VPSIAPSGMMFYTGDLFPDWKGNLFVGSMSAEHGYKLVRLVLNGDRVAAEEKLLADRKGRIRFMRQAPDGSIYLIAGAEIWRLTPKK